MILTRQLWFIFAFQNGSQAILFLLFILIFTIAMFVSKLQKKRKITYQEGIAGDKLYITKSIRVYMHIVLLVPVVIIILYYDH